MEDEYNVKMNTGGFLVFSLVIFFIGFLSGLVTKHPEVNYIQEKVYIDTCISKPIIKIDTMTKETVYNEMLNNNIQFPKVMLEWAVVETGHFTSHNCLHRNNLFGFSNERHIKEGNPNGYLTFKHWTDCIKWCADWQKRHYHGGDIYSWILEMNPGVDSSYINILKGVKLDG